ncbi:MAG: hypothetical protein QOJ82_1319 [Solirubrobacteraceae bacterium]|jgi:hypothetical protein|nr:hypothetical protein [Solirubrobacteraceae bacterium]
MTALRRAATVATLGSLALALSTASAFAKQAPITGKLSKPGYTLVALAASGKATSVRVNGTFELVPPANRVTLHLRSKSGVYAGPIVVGRSGAKAILGVKAGARLGAIAVMNGYAVTKKTPPARFVARSTTSKAKGGVPVGARVFGRVSSAAKGTAGNGRDQDQDGIPGAFDVDDDGDLILDNVDRAGARARVAQVGPPPGEPGKPGPGQPGQPGQPGAPGQPAGAPTDFRVFSNLKLGIESSINANAGSVTDAMIDEAVSRNATLAMQVPQADSVELDCGGLVYCSKGGTGRVLQAGAFPDAYDDDNDGFGTLTRGATGDFQLGVGATAAQIGSGDAFIEHVTTGSTVTQLPGVLNYVFSTTPSLVRWADGSGAAGEIPAARFPQMPGSSQAPLTLTPAGDGRIVATLTFWRPQRKAIEGSGEGTGWIDIGLLGYGADIPNGPSAGGPGAPGGAGSGRCDGGAYGAGGPGLSVDGDQVRDGQADRPADPANTVTFSVDLTRCLQNGGVAWNPGEVLAVDIQARSSYGDNAAQKIFFKRA